MRADPSELSLTMITKQLPVESEAQRRALDILAG